MRLWDASTGNEIRRFQGANGWYTSVACSPDGRRLASAGHEDAIEVWEAERDIEVTMYPGDFFGLSRVGLDAASGRYASIDLFRGVSLHDALTDTEGVTLQGPSLGGTLPVFSPDGRHVALGFATGVIRCWDTATGRLVREFDGLPPVIQALSFSADNRRFAAVCRARTTGEADEPPSLVRVWDLASGQVVSTLTGDVAEVRSVDLSPDGRRLVTGSGHRGVILWDATSGQPIRTLHDSGGYSNWWSEVRFSPDGRLVAALTGDEVICLYDAGSGRELLSLQGNQRTIRRLAFSPDSRRLASAGEDGQVRLWDLLTGQEVVSRPAPGGAARGLGFTRDGRRLLALSADGTLRIWEAGR